jgi:hypothetical protein
MDATDTAGHEVDLSLQRGDSDVARGGPTARLELHDRRLVAVSEMAITDDDIFDLIDSIRR